jgi:hypothetical protein
MQLSEFPRGESLKNLSFALTFTFVLVFDAIKQEDHYLQDDQCDGQ